MGLYPMIKPAFTCSKCGKTRQHNMEYDITPIVKQSENGSELLSVGMEADVVCRNCDHATKVSGVLSKFDTDLLGEIALALEVASIKNNDAAWSRRSPFQAKINELLEKAGRSQAGMAGVFPEPKGE